MTIPTSFPASEMCVRSKAKRTPQSKQWNLYAYSKRLTTITQNTVAYYYVAIQNKFR